MTTLEEHRAKVEEMKAAEKRVRTWLDDDDVNASRSDIRLLLERIDAYEASISWHTDCLQCPKLYEKNHHYFELLKRSLAFQQGLIEKRRDHQLIDDIEEALK